MALELETFFELFFQQINKIYDNYENNEKSNMLQLLHYAEIGAPKDLISEILTEIYNELMKQPNQNNACNFKNTIIHGSNRIINDLKISEFFLNQIRIFNYHDEEYKNIMISLLEVVLLDDFKRNDNFIRTNIYFKKILFDVLIKWKKSNNNDYNDDIVEFNDIVKKYNVRFDQYNDLSRITYPLYDIDIDGKLILYDFFEKKIIKYNKQDKVKQKLKQIKDLKEIKEANALKKIDALKKAKELKDLKDLKKANDLKKAKESKELKVLKQAEKVKIKNSSVVKNKKKPISSTIKKLVWNTNIGEEKGKSKCMCCNSTDISQMSFNCGHIIAESNGGKTIVSNLKPICQNCNSSMGTTDMNDFMKSLK